MSEIDEKVHNLIHDLLILGEDDPIKKNAVHLKIHMIDHQERIQAIKDRIKPGYIQMYTKAFDKQMIKEYLAYLKA